jgi:hypothetical protein
VENDIIARYNQIRPEATRLSLEAIQQDGRVVFRFSERRVRSDKMSCLVILAVWAALIVCFVAQILPTRFAGWFAGGLGLTFLYGLLRFARNYGHDVVRDRFTIDSCQQKIILHHSIGDEIFDLNEIDCFLYWTRRDVSETVHDVRLVTHAGKTTVLPFAVGEKFASVLGFLCDKPVYTRDPSDKFTKLASVDISQELLRPTSKPNANSDLVIPAQPATSHTPAQLLRAHLDDEI